MWKSVLNALIILALGSGNSFAVALFEDERSVVEDARDGKLEQHGLLESALLLSGKRQASNREAMLSRFGSLVESAKRQSTRNETDVTSVRRFITCLHAELLKGPFDADCDGVDRAFETGRYNCVTSLILALEFCRREKMTATAMQSRNHVWLRVGASEWMDIETTLLAVTDEMRLGAESISDAQLLARLLYNQARARHQQGAFEASAQRLEWCLLIDPSFTPAERNLRVVLGNWMAAAEADSQFSEAIAVNERAIARFHEDEELRQNADYLQERWAKWREEKVATE